MSEILPVVLMKLLTVGLLLDFGIFMRLIKADKPAIAAMHGPHSLGDYVRNKLNYRIGPKRSDSVIKLVSVLFGKCTTLVITKCWPMETTLPRGDQ